MCQRDGPVLAVGEEPEGLLELGAVGVRVVLAGVELERADGEEGLVGCVAVRVGVEDGDEFFEFGGGGGRDAEGALGARQLL